MKNLHFFNPDNLPGALAAAVPAGRSSYYYYYYYYFPRGWRLLHSG